MASGPRAGHPVRRLRSAAAVVDFLRSAADELLTARPLRAASGTDAVVGGWGRLGNVGDGNIIGAAGIPSVQYGAGDIRTYKEWPTPDERVKLWDLVTAARAVAHATYRLCG